MQRSPSCLLFSLLLLLLIQLLLLLLLLLCLVAFRQMQLPTETTTTTATTAAANMTRNIYQSRVIYEPHLSSSTGVLIGRLFVCKRAGLPTRCSNSSNSIRSNKRPDWIHGCIFELLQVEVAIELLLLLPLLLANEKLTSHLSPLAN